MNRLPFRSAVAALALCALSAAAEQNLFVRVRSFQDFSTAATALTGAVGQPLAGGLVVAQIRMQAAQLGELREDAPLFLACRVEPSGTGVYSADAFEENEPTELLLALPFSSLDEAAVADMMPDWTRDPATGRWTNDDGSVMEVRDGYVRIAQDEATLASADKVLGAKPFVDGALAEALLDDPALWSQTNDQLVDEMASSLAEAFGISDAADKLRALLAVTQTGAEDAERVALDLFVDEDGTLAFSMSTALRAGSPTAARLAAARTAGPELFARIPARSPLYVAAGGPAPDQDVPALLAALAPFFDGPAPSGNPAATAQRAAFRDLLAAAAKTAGNGRDATFFLDFDPAGRFFLKSRLTDDSPADVRRAATDAFLRFVRSFPNAERNGVTAEADGDLCRLRFATRPLVKAIAAACDEGQDCADDPSDEKVLAFLVRLFGETVDAVGETDPATGVSLGWAGETSSVEASRALGDAAPRGRAVDAAKTFAPAALIDRAPGDVLSAGAFSYARLFKRVLAIGQDLVPDLPEEAIPALFEGVDEDGEPIRFATVRGENVLANVFTISPDEVRFLFNVVTVGVESQMQAAAPVFYEEDVEDEDEEEDEPRLSPEETDEEDDGLNSLED